MINLLSGEFYKLRKSKCVYICGLIMVVFVFLLYGVLFLADKIQKNEAENGSFGIVVEEQNEGNASPILDEVGILDVAQQCYGSISQIIVAIFACIFVIGEYGHGAIKNVMGKGYARWKIFLAKYISVTVASVLMMIIMSIVNLLCGGIFIGTDGWNREFYQDWFGYTGIQILFGVALIGIIIVISEICRNLGSGISVSICLITFSSILTAGLNLLFFKWNFKVSDYWVLDLITNCPLTNIESDFLVRAIVSSVLWIVLSLGIGALHIQKADVK